MVERTGIFLRRLLAGVALAAVLATSGVSQLEANLGDSRTLTFFNIHTKETTSVLYKKDGKVVPGAYEKLNWVLRDWRANEKTTMDPALYDLLWEMHTELGSKEPIHIISAYRSRGTNNMLRATTGGQASESRHILGKAIDVHFPDVEIKKLRYSALIREQGGVGYYPTSAIPFVHVDTDRVRAWPRLPRLELALLFPNGKTQHMPADGGPITPDDVKVARAQHKDLAQQVAAYLDLRRTPKAPVAVAEAPKANTQKPIVVAAAAPQLLEAPKAVERSSRLSGPSAADRQKLSELMTLASAMPEPKLMAAPQPARRPQPAAPPSLTGNQIAPQATPQAPAPRVAALDPKETLTDSRSGWSNGFAIAPAFDEEHPEELSYRPFPIAPLLTLTASADDPALVNMTHPDVAKTLDMLDQAGSVPPMRLRPQARVAAMMWTQQFKGDAVSAATFRDETEAQPQSQSPLSSRKVTSTR